MPERAGDVKAEAVPYLEVAYLIALCYEQDVKAVSYGRDAAKDLRRHGSVAGRIIRAVDDYAADPKARANNVTQLVGSTAKRMRVGDFRVIFEETEREILVTKVGPRSSVYD
jgi:mRNA interferase RelE/StbE